MRQPDDGVRVLWGRGVVVSEEGTLFGGKVGKEPFLVDSRSSIEEVFLRETEGFERVIVVIGDWLKGILLFHGISLLIEEVERLALVLDLSVKEDIVGRVVSKANFIRRGVVSVSWLGIWPDDLDLAVLGLGLFKGAETSSAVSDLSRITVFA